MKEAKPQVLNLTMDPYLVQPNLKTQFYLPNLTLPLKSKLKKKTKRATPQVQSLDG